MDKKGIFMLFLNPVKDIETSLCLLNEYKLNDRY